MKEKKYLLVVFILIAFTSLSAQEKILYGTTNGGGKYGKGTVFSYDITDSIYTVLVNFDSINGAAPTGDFSLNPADGLLYSFTNKGGKNNKGVIFSINPATGKDSVRCMIDNIGSTSLGEGALTLYDGIFYGVSSLGGMNDNGVLFSFDPATGKDSVLKNLNFSSPFTGAGAVGLTLYKGNLYGTTISGGDSGTGTIFSYDPSNGVFSLLYSFTSASGQFPNGGFVLNPKNNLLFSTTSFGGSSGNGVIFSFDPNKAKGSVWLNFDGTNGSQSYSRFTIGNNGLFYSLTTSDGSGNSGEIYSFDPTLGNINIFNITNVNEPGSPGNDLAYDSVGNIFYGDGEIGGPKGYGAIFSFDATKDSLVELHDFTGADGASPYGSMYLISTAPSSVSNVSEIKRDMTVYPNPFSSYTNVVFNESGIHYTELYDVTGRLLKTIESSSRQLELFREGLVSGMYFIKVYDSEHKYLSSSKLIAQ